jgi:hypothetical protein
MRRSIVVLVALFTLCGGPAFAADQAVLGKALVVKNGGEPAKRKIVIKAKESASVATIAGDPTTGGATLVLDAIGDSVHSQTFNLPAGVGGDGKPFWSGDAVKGYTYKDKTGANGAVKVAKIKKAASGVFQIKAILSGKIGDIDVLPPSDGTRGCALLSIGGGDTYSLRFADGKIKNKEDKLFKVTNPETAGTCINCDPLDDANCLFPFPSDWFTVADDETDTGKRVNFSSAVMPRNAGGVPMQFAAWNTNDGFSPGASIILRVPNVDLAVTGAAPVTDIEQSLDADAPIVVINATTLQKHPVWAELDANATSEAGQTLIIRPAVNFDEAQRYVVALRQIKDGDGVLIAPDADFAAYRDDTPTGDPVKESRRGHMEDVFDVLADAGIARNDLYLAWDFTVASSRNITERLLFMRDDGFDRLGADAPVFTVTNVDEAIGDGRLFSIVDGTFEVERYVNATTAGAVMVLGPDGLPLHQPTPQVANFRCIIPLAAHAFHGSPAVPARASIYGHGLLGAHTEVSAGNVRNMANEHNFVFCATKWIGMSNEDVANAVAILGQLGNFPSFTDRLQQAMLNQLFLARLMIHPDGFVSHAAFQDDFGDPVIDTSDVFYDGNSQGGIFGGTVMSIAQDITRGVLGVPGMNYSLLLTRSVDFDLYKAIYYPAYPDELVRPLGLALIQMLWDRSEPNGYAHHMTDDPLPNTPPHEVLLHVAFGDHQVSNLATEIQARTIGASIHQPALAPARHSDVNPYFDIPAIPSYPFAGSALIIWDSGAPTPPITNTPPYDGDDPHSDPRNYSVARQQKSDFLQTGGAVTDVCSGLPCVAP